ncbi:MAG: TusE/DsrC/DsvC family sulfur relay protein [Gammaproteobacteria bacterium]|nr:TusE/DsrC/DsvC family sulfur relay protein [Gammaproteobacteria bacterium]
MSLTVNGRTLPRDSEGYLSDPGDWEPEVAEALAREAELELTQEHWQVLSFMRSYFEQHGIAADARFVLKYLDTEKGLGRGARRYLYELFPYGYVQQACKIAGMKRPRAWSVG